MAQVTVKYVPNNLPGVGYGGLLMGRGTQRVAATFASHYMRFFAVTVAAAEAEAAGHQVAPGDVLAAFANMRRRADVRVIKDGGYVNPRRSVTIEASRPYKGRSDSVTRSSSVTYEFGSKYNEGMRGDRPRLRPMGKAVIALAAAFPGVRATEISDLGGFSRDRV